MASHHSVSESRSRIGHRDAQSPSASCGGLNIVCPETLCVLDIVCDEHCMPVLKLSMGAQPRGCAGSFRAFLLIPRINRLLVNLMNNGRLPPRRLAVTPHGSFSSVLTISSPSSASGGTSDDALSRLGLDTRAHAHTNVNTHARTHARTHAHVHTRARTHERNT
jgi:hypothetical protein